MLRNPAGHGKYATHKISLIGACILAAVFGLIDCSAGAQSLAQTADACIPVDVAELYNDPTPYMGETICIEAFIQVEFEAMEILPTAAPIDAPYSFSVGIDLPYGRAIELGIRTLDRVAVKGTLLGNASCITNTALCWGAPVGIADPQVELLSRPDPWDTCSRVPAEDLIEHPDTFRRELICTEGEIVSGFYSFQIQDSADSPDTGEPKTLEIGTIHIHDGTDLRLPGDHIEVAGYFTGTSLQSFEIRAHETRSISESCLHTTVDHILDNPYQYREAPVCLEGYITSIADDLAIVDSAPQANPGRATQTRIYALLPRGSDIDFSTLSETRLTIRGLINVDDMYVNNSTFDELEARYLDDPLFTNANTPLTLIVYEVESTPGSHTCTSVSIEDLYRDPTPYVGQRICMNGIVHVAYEGMALYGEGMDPAELIDVRIFPPFDYDEAIRRSISSGDQLSVEGVFTVNQECLDGTDPAYPDDEPFFCIPIRLPAWFDDADYEVIE